jgi:branched-subunit amino acid transport protein AzlD
MEHERKEYFLCKISFISYFLARRFQLVSLVSYKRQNQFVGRLNMILNLILLGLFVYRSLNISGETVLVSEKGIGMFLPIVAIVLLVLANKAIKR